MSAGDGGAGDHVSGRHARDQTQSDRSASDPIRSDRAGSDRAGRDRLERRGRLATPSPTPAPAFFFRMVEANGIQLHVAELGEGPPVLLLHGFPECWFGWRHAMVALADAGYRAIAIDLPGYNLSDKPEPVEAYYLEQLATHIEGLLDSLELPTVRLAGHDWGGALAWTFAMRYPERVERLVVMNMPHPVIFAEAWRTLRQRVRSAYFYFFRLRGFASWVFRAFHALGQRAMLWWFSGRTLSEAELDVYAKAGLQPGAMRASMSYYTALLAREPEASLEGAEPLALPVRVLWGDRDPAFDKGLANPGSWAPDCEVTYLEGAGHFVHLERPDEVSRLLVRALRE